MPKIVRFHETGEADVLRLEEVATPVPKGDEVLVRMYASSVNMADVDYLLGRPKVARLGTGVAAPRVVAGAMAAKWLAYRM